MTSQEREHLEVLRAFADQHSDHHEVESICRVFQIALSGYRRLIPEDHCVWDTKLPCYDEVKVWKQLRREGIEVTRCTLDRLMRWLDYEA